MAVEFQRGEFGSEFRNQWRVDPPAIQALFEAMEAFDGTPRQARTILLRVNAAANQHGVESVAPERNANGRELIYVNTGDTYNGTVGYDVRREAFILTTWGGWIEEAEREIHEDQGEPARNDEEVCASCGLVWNIEELVDDICERCRPKPPKPPPTWTPPSSMPLVAMLRSIEGLPVAVHMWSPTTELFHHSGLRETVNNPVLTFSVPYGKGTFISTHAWGGRRTDRVPFTNTWAELVRVFQQMKQRDLYVATTDGTASNVGIERDQFQRLAVAMDSFFERGMERQAKEFLTVPPVLWTCDELNVDWYEERGEATVRVFTGQDTEHVRSGGDPLEVWSTRSPDLESLIEDGFFKWGDNRSLLEYLQEIGICRAK